MSIVKPLQARLSSLLLSTITACKRPSVPIRWPVGSQQRSITIKQLEAAKNDRERVVILGSGWAGYNLARSLNPKKFQTVVVSPRSYFVFTPLLASTSVGTLEFRTALEPVRSHGTKYEYIQGRADAVDFGKKEIMIRETVRDPNQGFLSTRAGEEKDERPIEMRIEASRGELFSMPYDKLVIGVGAYSQTYGIPGVKDNAFFLKDVQDARKIRNKLLSCFETAALPTTPIALEKQLLNFAIVGGGPTGIEFSGELQDIIRDDMTKLYPSLIEHVQITVYDVADKILPMFDETLAKYAAEHCIEEGVNVKTSRRILGLKRGFPKVNGSGNLHDDVKASGFTLSLQNGEESEVGCGLVVWSTGLMSNPFIEKALSPSFTAPASCVRMLNDIDSSPESTADWKVQKHERTGSVVTDDFLRVQLEPAAKHEGRPNALLRDVYALGDCTVTAGTQYPATAQKASQQARWLAKKLNKGDVDTRGFSFESQGIMAYVGAYRAIVQLNKGSLSGRTAWLMWRGAYLTKSISWRNRLLIPMYWFVNWCVAQYLPEEAFGCCYIRELTLIRAFGRDISRF